MNCAFHTERTAVAQCVDCGRGLCEECAAEFSIAICENCYNVRIEKDKENIKEEKRELRFEAYALFWKHAFWGLLIAVFALVLIIISQYKEFKASEYDNIADYVVDAFKGASYTAMEENPENPGEMIMVEKEHDISGVFIVPALLFGFPFGWHAVNWFKRRRSLAGEINDAVLSATNEIYAFVSIIIFALKLVLAMSFGWALSIVYFIIMIVKLILISRK